MRSRIDVLACGVAIAALVSGCGNTTVATSIDATSAVLQARVDCVPGMEPDQQRDCTYFFQFWESGEGTRIRTTPERPLRLNQSVNATEFVSGLTPDTVYHYQICGEGGVRGIGSPSCAGQRQPPANGRPATNAPFEKPATGAALEPGDPGSPFASIFDLSAVSSFRTAGNGLKATVDLGRVLSDQDTQAMPLRRDAGVSTSFVDRTQNPPVPRTVWAWADGSQNLPTGGRRFVSLSSIAIGPFEREMAPQELIEQPTPPNQAGPTLRGVFPRPTGLQLESGRPCTGGAARSWVSGAAKIPVQGPDILFTYQQVCTANGNSASIQRMTLVTYDPLTNQITSQDTPFSASPLSEGLDFRQDLRSPIFVPSENQLYLYAAECPNGRLTSCNGGPGRVVVARVGATQAAWRNADAYTYRGANGWVFRKENAIDIAPGVVPIGGGVSVAFYPAKPGNRDYVMVAQNAFGIGRFTVFDSAGPEGPFREIFRGQVPSDCPTTGVGSQFLSDGTKVENPARQLGCYALVGHPELSSSEHLVISHMNSGDRPEIDHMRLMKIRWN